MRHYLNTQAILDKHEVSWIATEQPYLNTSTPHGRAFVNNSMIWAELEALNDSEKILAVFDDKVDNGEVLSGSTPLGYSMKDKHLIPNEDAPTVVAIFDFYHKHSNLAMTIRHMQEEYKIVRSPSAFKKMFKNKKYIGEFRDNKNYCPPIIDKDIFFDVQRLLEMNIKSGEKKHEYIFSGLVICDECSRRMSACQKSSSGRVRLDGTRANYKYSAYRCRYATSIKSCGNSKSLFESILERTVLASLHSELEKHIRKFEVSNLPALRTEAKQRNINNKIAELKDLYLNDLITLNGFKVDREKLIFQLEKLEKEEQIPVKDLSYLKNFLKIDFESMYTPLSISDKRKLWRSFIREIRINEDKKISLIFL